MENHNLYNTLLKVQNVRVKVQIKFGMRIALLITLIRLYILENIKITYL